MGIGIIKFARISCTWIKEALTVNLYIDLMMGMSENDHLRSGVLLGQIALIASERVAHKQILDFIVDIMGNIAMSMCKGELHTVEGQVNVCGEFEPIEPIAVALHSIYRCYLRKMIDNALSGDIPGMQDVFY